MGKFGKAAVMPPRPAAIREPGPLSIARYRLGAALLGLLLGGAEAALALPPDPAPLGDQFLINTYTTSSQFAGSVARRPGGEFVVVWDSEGSFGNDNSQFSVQGQLFSAAGLPVGSQFQVNTYTTLLQNQSRVASSATGSFVVVWTSQGSSGGDTSSFSIQAQRFSAAGTPVGSQFQVNTYTPNEQGLPAVSMNASGQFLVTWESVGSPGTDSDLTSIQGRAYLASGTPLGNQSQINSYTPGFQAQASVVLNDDGSFVVAWASPDEIHTRHQSAAAPPVVSEFQVNTYSTGSQSQPAVAADASGNFLVTWTSAGDATGDTDGKSIQGRSYTSTAAPAGAQFRINSYTSGDQYLSHVSEAADGHFRVTWTSYGSPGSDTDQESIQGQLVSAGGAHLGNQFQVNTDTPYRQTSSSVAELDEGVFIVVWSSDGSTGDPDPNAGRSCPGVP